MSDKVSITPVVLKWARESAKISIETAATRIGVPCAKLVEWENGFQKPTVKQAESLAKIYRRPFAIFFLPEVPTDFQQPQDFRRNDSIPLGSASTIIIREIQQKQNWLSEFYRESGERPLGYVGKYALNSDPNEVAKNILETLNINAINPSPENRLKVWIKCAEAKGIFVSRTSFIHSRLKLNADEIKGFAIADPYAPFVFVNSGDWDNSQLFTLIHELAHIWIAASGLSNYKDTDFRNFDKFHPVELFCNEVAACVLMPEAIFESMDDKIFYSGRTVFEFAKKFGVSSYAFILRAFNLKRITLAKYNSLKDEVDTEFKAFVLQEDQNKRKEIAKGKRAGPNYYTLLVNKNGHSFTKVVLDSYNGGRIQPTLASDLLNTKTNNFSKMVSFLT